MTGADAVPLDPLQALVGAADARVPSISDWSVGRHIAHCCLAMSSILQSLGESTPPRPPRGFSLRRFAILRLGRIPRGRAQAPKAVVLDDEPEVVRLHELLESARELLAEAQRLPADAWFRHFALGVLDRDECLRFLAVHNAHHVRIAREVVASA